MDSRKNLGWVLVGMALGAAGIALLTRRHKDLNPWDAEGILRACDRAAQRLESLVQAEQPVTSTSA